MNEKVLKGFLQMGRALNTTSRDLNKVSPVKLAFASYQNTQSEEQSPSSPNQIPAPLVVMHGLFGSKANWNSLCKSMLQKTKPQRKVIAVDARNHGDSPHTPEHSYDHMAMDMKRFLSDHGMTKAALLGHSMGGRTMMMVALKYPYLVEKLVVADISPVKTINANLRQLSIICKELKAIKFADNSTLSVGRVQADRQLKNKIPDLGVRAFLLTNLVQRTDGSVGWRMHVDAILQNFDHIQSFPKMENLKFEGPTLFVTGGLSDYVQKTDHPQIREIFPNVQFHMIKGAGHWLHTEKPEEFLQVVCDFLNGTKPPPS